ncbi:ATP-binding protein involved in chromosome partitioning [Saccharomonospora amisosensis]|uniref:Iron-sulfur cluster carrier protein n=1 Tax=Saccharomonospora amisosensis TaxID=1128677 RepID=A0A7X5USE0_9PSEU|nr:P-loop NTPase [Saccharomonospora amisosensis]NIJ12997.1 ATP-binding protein involved in chromosome partitioning [Saccharomonospora amisosensis]
MITRESILDALRDVDDPELHRSIVDLEMVREIDIDGTEVTVHLALTIAGCPLRDYFHRVVPERVQAACPEVTAVRVELTAMTEEERSRVVGGVRVTVPRIGESGSNTRIIAVGSGKGGVGKSTVAVNLATALAAHGHRVGLLDADIWGFSVPHMLGATGRPTVVDDLIMPLQAHGLAVLSIGNFVPEDGPVVWRGPMLHKALEQMLGDVHWDDRDYLVVDMPPGTGDVSISLAQFLPNADFLLVTTPHESAERVALRAGRMMTKVGLRLVGVVENMASFVCGDCDREHDLFGTGAGTRLAELLDTPLLARIPLEPAFATTGTPTVLAHPESAGSTRFAELAETISAKPSLLHRPLPLFT